MAYIEAHQSLRDHRKILALAAELDMPEPHVAGHCLYLWLWSLDNAPDGALPQSVRIIERAAAWVGEPGTFVGAMVTVGMLERDCDGVLHIHDWYDYAGRLIEKRKANAARMRDARASTPDDRATHVQRTFTARAGATVPNRTVTYQHVKGEDNLVPFAPPTGLVVAADAADDTDSLLISADVSLNGHTPLQADVAPSPLTAPLPPSPSPPPAARRKPAAKPSTPAPVRAREPNPIWDALVGVFGYEPETAAERGKWGKAVHDIKASPSGTAEEVRRRAGHHAALLAAGEIAWTLTPLALASHWGELGRVDPANGHGHGARRNGHANGYHPPGRASPAAAEPVRAHVARAVPPLNAKPAQLD